MKKLIILQLIVFPFLLSFNPVKAQEFELQQLILNIEKLNQLRAILDNMYKGYKVLSTGYQTIKNLAEGNFDLHKVFLDGLLEVSPTVKKYKKVAEIISNQRQLVKEYKSAFRQFKELNLFEPKEIDYLHTVYENLIGHSLENLDELLMVITSGQLRMNDAERLSAIDRIASDMQDKFQFLRHFNSKTSVLATQRKKSKQEFEDIQRIYGIKK